MKKFYAVLVTFICCMYSGGLLIAEEVKKTNSDNAIVQEDKQILKDQKDKVSYCIGMDIGNNFKKQSLEVNQDILFQGFKDAYNATEKPLMTVEEMQETMVAFQKELMAKRTETTGKIKEKNKKEGEEFLAKNKVKKGVKTLKSGLQYKIVSEGKGESPKLSDVVTVNYKGTLIDGTEFDSSYKRGEPATFPVSGVIPGWTEALQLMKAGAKWELYVPAELAYGDQGAGQDIGPGATLIFEVELLSTQKNKDK